MSSNHTKGELAQMRSLPLEQKVLMTKKRIREWYDHWNGEVSVSFSGGKDSTVLKHIVDSMYADVPSVFVNTGLEYPELQRFVHEIKRGEHQGLRPNVEILTPEMKFTEVISNYGYPAIGKRQADAVYLARKNLKAKKYTFRLANLGVSVDEAQNVGLHMPDDSMLERYKKSIENSKFRISHYKKMLDADFEISSLCCDYMKKKPIFEYSKQTGRKGIVATMTEESATREAAWLKNGCNAFESKHPHSAPMSFWTEQDVLKYLVTYNVPYAPVYGQIVQDENGRLKTTECERTGCIYCAFGCQTDKHPNRFESLKSSHPRQYEYCINGGEYVDGLWKPNRSGLGLAHVLDYLDIAY